MDQPKKSAVERRNQLRQQLWDDIYFAHMWLCHPDGKCPDGCDTRAHPKRVVFYQSELETTTQS